MSNRHLLRLTATSTAALWAMLAQGLPALAADAAADEEIGEVVVTGSRITRQDFVSPSPIVTLGADQLLETGRPTMDDYLRDMPQFTAGAGDFSNDSNGGTAGRATLNLRGLGPQRNLVLLDGQRLMSSGTDGAIDINTIPSLALGGVEIISGGASATYGSDALSGVVNFQTRRDLQGLEATAQLSATDDFGATSTQVGAVFGTDLSDGRGYLLLSAEHLDRGGVQTFERDFFLNPVPSSFITQGRSRIGANFLSVNDDGTIFNQMTGVGYRGTNELPVLRGNPATQSGLVGFHGSFDNYLQVPLRRTALFAKADHALWGNVSGYAQAMYTIGEARNIGSPPNVAGAPWIVTIPATNPSLVALRAANPGQFGTGPIGVYQARITQSGPRVYFTENETSLFKAGLKGRVGERDLRWDVHASLGRAVNDDRTISGAASVSALQRLLNAPDGGNSLCAGGYNPFGGNDPLSPACVDFIARRPLNSATLDQWVVEGLLEGAAFQMPAGGARFALTAQYRSNDYAFDPDRDIETGDLANLAVVLPTSGSIRAIEAGGELLLPLLKDASFAKEVNLTLGYRFADYNLAGNANTFKVEFDGRVNDALLLRGGYQRAVRAPNVGEFFLAGESRVVGIGSPPSGGDPCDRRNNPTGDRLRLCQFEGVAANYQASTASTPAINRGNRNLTTETADTLTAGFVLDLPIGGTQLQFSTDYYSIRIDDAISAISAADSLQQCYLLSGSTPGFNPAQYRANNFFCRNFGRSGIGELTPIDQPVLNLGRLQTTGLDFAASWRIPADFLAWGGGGGSLQLSTNVTHLLSYEINNFAGQPTLDFAGTISTATPESFPEWRGFTSLAVETGPLTLTASWRYFSSMNDRSTAINPASTVAGVPAYSYFDLNARVQLFERIDLVAGVLNLTDKGPPVVGGNPSSTNPGTYDIIGRTPFVSVKARF